jgi:hypothetical protein
MIRIVRERVDHMVGGRPDLVDGEDVQRHAAGSQSQRSLPLDAIGGGTAPTELVTDRQAPGIFENRGVCRLNTPAAAERCASVTRPSGFPLLPLSP